MFECQENGIIEGLISVWIMVSVLSLSLLSVVGAGGSIKRMHCIE
jgi:hypothetical protein